MASNVARSPRSDHKLLIGGLSYHSTPFLSAVTDMWLLEALEEIKFEQGPKPGEKGPLAHQGK